jgi:lysyl-tRNA synthetase class 2
LAAPRTESGAAWRPTASPDNLRARADILARIRSFFAKRGVLEVETPAVSRAAATDPHLASLTTSAGGQGAYLHTSPEFAMKRLLAAGSGDIYQVCKVFRDGEQGRWHNPEFTLLEWYRKGFDHHRLMDEVEELFGELLAGFRAAGRAVRMTYAEAFGELAGLDPHAADVAACVRCAAAHDLELAAEPADRDEWLDVIGSHVVYPKLGLDAPVFVYDFPASQAALARIRPGRPPVAERFEVFLDGVELANGFHELTDATEQARRFARDNAWRAAHGQAVMPEDRHLLAALEAGLPDCAGVAVGLDRLVMLAVGAEAIDDVLAFPLARA